MIRFSNISVMNFDNALRGARNPMNSWDKSDSYSDADGTFQLGEKDRTFARGLCMAGSDERKFIRQIFVSIDITAPLYWWKEFDTYKVATVANSTSTMHKIHARPFSVDDFSHDRMSAGALEMLRAEIAYLEQTRLRYLETRDKGDWYDMIQLLPSSYEQMRTVTCNYETMTNIYFARRAHKLDEWRAFCAMIRELPYAADLIYVKEEKEAHAKKEL